jgi:hypothetical protein
LLRPRGPRHCSLREGRFVITAETVPPLSVGEDFSRGSI